MTTKQHVEPLSRAPAGLLAEQHLGSLAGPARPSRPQPWRMTHQIRSFVAAAASTADPFAEGLEGLKADVAEYDAASRRAYLEQNPMHRAAPEIRSPMLH